MQVARGYSRVQASPSEPQVDSLPSRASLLLRLGRSASFGAADGPHRSAAAAAAEVGVAAIGLEPRYTHARRHVDFLQDLSRLGVDPPQVALVAFPRAVPEFAVDPGAAGDAAVGLDGAKDGTRFGVEIGRASGRGIVCR